MQKNRTAVWALSGNGVLPNTTAAVIQSVAMTHGLTELQVAGLSVKAKQEEPGIERNPSRFAEKLDGLARFYYT